MITQWDDKYSLNYEKIDKQHKELFRLAKLVDLLDEKTTKNEISKLLNEFFIYMKEHFNAEENYMKKINYPLYKHHHNLHADIIEEFTNLIKENHILYEIKAKMKIATKKWLVDHILENDLKIKRWLELNH